jgi:hypothetical protein
LEAESGGNHNDSNKNLIYGNKDPVFLEQNPQKELVLEETSSKLPSVKITEDSAEAVTALNTTANSSQSQRPTMFSALDLKV